MTPSDLISPEQICFISKNLKQKLLFSPMYISGIREISNKNMQNAIMYRAESELVKGEVWDLNSL